MKVFQESKSKLKELNQQSGKKMFDYEKMIQSLVENNLNVVFPSLEFLTTEYQIDSLRPDSIAFDSDRNSFVIIEYKNVKHKGVVDQGMSYYELLQEKREAFVLLYHKKKGKLLDVENDVNWDETRVIFISPHFTSHQKRASRSVNLPIELYEVSRFENGIITLVKLENKQDTKEKTSTHTPLIRLDEYSEEDYLTGKYSKSGKKNIPPNIKKLWNTTKNKILDEFENVEFKQKKKYAGFYSIVDGSSICTINVTKSKVFICYAVRTQHNVLSPDDFIKDVSNIGHWGLGHYQSSLKTESDLEKAIPIIRKVYDHKIK